MIPEITAPQALALATAAFSLAVMLGWKMLSQIVRDVERIPPKEWFQRAEKHFDLGDRQAGVLQVHEGRLVQAERDLEKVDERVRTLERG